MSGALQALSAVGGIGQSVISATGLMPAWIRAERKIDKIIPDVTIEESHSDRLTVTQHPVAQGSPVHDHAFKLPATITMRLGFTNAVNIGGVVGGAIGSVISGGSIGGALSGAGSSLLSSFKEQRTIEIYKQLRDLQFNQEAWDKGEIPLRPFTLKTGKREYKNMVITELSVRTDRTSEYALMIEVHMQEVKFVQTASTTQPSQTNQSASAKTASPNDQSEKKPEPVKSPNSILGDFWSVRA